MRFLPALNGRESSHLTVDLLKLARPLMSRILVAVVTSDVRCHQLVLGAFSHRARSASHRARSARILSG